MPNKHKIAAIGFFTTIFTILFYQQSAGINMLIFELLYLLFILRFARQSIQSPLAWIFFGGTILTAVFTVITNSVFVILFNCISLLLLTGVLIFPNAVSVISVAALAFYNLLLAQVEGFNTLIAHKSGGRPLRKFVHYLKIIIVPVAIVTVFVFIYKSANPVFSKVTNNFFADINAWFTLLFQRVDFWLITTIFFGYLLSNVLVFQHPVAEVIAYDGKSDGLLRVRNPNFNSIVLRNTALKNEYRAAVFLFFSLNLLLLIVNIIDINWVWLHFDWSGQYLKQFVHEGTWLLILSILISIVLVLFFFRGNLNFFTRNKTLKTLSYVWLIQNGILAVSVGIRNFYYIQHFALAYKRIGVLVFLFLVLIGLASVIYKIHQRKSAFFTTRVNALSLYLVLLVASLFNWDSIIARYNFNHYQTAFVHLDFLSDLSDKALPYLIKSDAELLALKESQEKLFHFDYTYMKPQQYKRIIDYRIENFINKWEEKGFLSWNYPEYRAYQILK